MAVLSYGEYITNFYLVTSFKKILPNLISGELHGLKGISSNKDGIAKHWFDIRNVMIEMNATRTMKINDIEPIKYNNGDDLVKDNLMKINRICSNPDIYINGEKTPRSHVFNQFRSGAERSLNSEYKYLRKLLKTPAKIREFEQCFNFFDMYYYQLEKLYIENNFFTNDIMDLAEFTMSNLSNIRLQTDSWFKQFDLSTFTDDMWYNFYNATVIIIAKAYINEQEWIIKNKDFKIPQKSTMYIKVKELKNSTHSSKYESYDESYDEIFKIIKDNKLDEIYTIRFVGHHSDMFKKPTYSTALN